MNDPTVTPAPAAASGGRPPQDGTISEEAVDRTRSWTGLYVVVGGDIAIAVAAIIALFKFASASANTNSAVLPSILSSAFAVISTMTTAYFGIRESSTMAQKSIKHQSSRSATTSDHSAGS